MSIPLLKTPKNRVMEELFQILGKNYSKEVQDEKVYDFYNRHLEFFNDIESKSGNSLIAQIIDAKNLYISILDSKEKYKEANLVCKDLPILLSKLDEGYYQYDEKYKRCSFWEGVITNRLKKYNESKKKFKYLLESGEINEKNKEWYIYGLLGVWNKYFKYIAVPISCLYILGIILSFCGITIPFRPKTNFFLALVIIYFFNDYFAEKIITYFVNRKYKTDEPDKKNNS